MTIRKRCLAMTQKGTICKLSAVQGEKYCHVHIHMRKERQQGWESRLSKKTFGTWLEDAPEDYLEEVDHFLKLYGILNESESYTAPPYSESELVRLLQDELIHISPEISFELLHLVLFGFEQLNHGVNKGQKILDAVWYILNFASQVRRESADEKFSDPLKLIRNHLPGLETIKEIRLALDGSSPEDFLDPDTWKGLWYVLSYNLREKAV